jgi:hypothetical protein
MDKEIAMMITTPLPLPLVLLYINTTTFYNSFVDNVTLACAMPSKPTAHDKSLSDYRQGGF